MRFPWYHIGASRGAWALKLFLLWPYWKPFTPFPSFSLWLGCCFSSWNKIFGRLFLWPPLHLLLAPWVHLTSRKQPYHDFCSGRKDVMSVSDTPWALGWSDRSQQSFHGLGDRYAPYDPLLFHSAINMGLRPSWYTAGTRRVRPSLEKYGTRGQPDLPHIPSFWLRSSSQNSRLESWIYLMSPLGLSSDPISPCMLARRRALIDGKVCRVSSSCLRVWSLCLSGLAMLVVMASPATWNSSVFSWLESRLFVSRALSIVALDVKSAGPLHFGRRTHLKCYGAQSLGFHHSIRSQSSLLCFPVGQQSLFPVPWWKTK